MQPVNDDMDALFRRAAEDYPLNTGKADFEALLQKMHGPGEADAPAAPKEQRRNYSWLLLLLLLIPFVCKYYPGNEDGNSPHPTAQNDRKTNSTNKNATTQKITANNSQPENSNTNSGNELDSQPSDQKISATDKPSVSADKPVNSSSNKAIAAPVNNTTTRHTSLSNRKRKTVTATIEQPTQDKYSAVFANDRKQKHGNGQDKKQKGALESNTTAVITKGSEAKDSSFATEKTVSGVKKNIIANKQDTSITTTAKNDTIATVKNTTAPFRDSTVIDSTTIAAKKQEKKKVKQKPFFYLGVVGGIDYSAVKSKETAGSGSNVGVVLGYSFGRHWAVETGFIRAYKKYRAEGEYVDTTGLGLAPHTQVANVYGSCSIFEIPVNVQFHFGNKATSHWYVGTGISSYLMKKERYDYMGKRYNMVYYSEKEYINSTKNWLSILQFGGGYQLQMGKAGSLRAEPYIKLPLSKIGVASLPLSSAGINIGYTIPL